MKTFLVTTSVGVRICLLWHLLLAGRHSVGLECVNDYETEMSCSWEATTSGISCKHDYVLLYKNLDSEEIQKCVPQTLKMDTLLSSNKCICFLENTVLSASSNYSVDLQLHEKSVQKLDVYPYRTVKPRTPGNVSIDLSEENIAEVTWNNMYPASSLLVDLMYEIHITSKQDPKEVKSIGTLEMQQRIDKKQLKRGNDYMVKVRSKHGGNEKEIWSEWSPVAEWHNDYSLTNNELMKIYLPIFCIAIVIMALSCYATISFCKKNWWNNIPDPAKSKLAQEKPLARGSGIKPDKNSLVLPVTKKQKLKRACANWLNKWIFRKTDQNETSVPFCQTCKASRYQNLFQSRAPEYLIPEILHIESHIEMLPIEDDRNSLCIEIGDNYDLDPSMDLMIQKMFDVILEDSSCKTGVTASMVEDSVLKEHSNFVGFPLFPDEQPEVSVTFGYHHGTSSSTTGELQTICDGYKLFCPDQCSGGQKPYSPKDDHTKCLSENLPRNDTIVDSDYNSFASAVSSSEDKTVCFHNLDNDSAMSLYFDELQISPGFGNTSPLSWDHKDNSFYNLNSCLSSHSTDQDNIGSQIVDLVPEYKSFASVVQQENLSVYSPFNFTECTVLESGYKSFDSLVTQNGEPSDFDNCNYLLDLNPSVSYHTSKEKPGNETYNLLSDSSVNAKVNFEKDPQDELSSSFINKHQMECCLNNNGGSATLEKNNMSYAKESFYQNNIGGNLDIKTNTKMTLQDQHKKDIELALTFDITDHLRNFSNLNRNDPLSKRVCKKIVTGEMDQETSFCPANPQPSLPKAILFSIQDQLGFIDTPNFLKFKFEHISDFVSPYHLKPVLLLNDIGTNSNKSLNHLLVHDKVLDKDGNSYMELAHS
ncbi:interleukin-4 receptor subunit alpha isoform 2-T2 [Discoglossus pictus]